MTDTVLPLIETERALVGVVLTEPRTIIPVSGVIRPDDLNDLLCARVLQAAFDLAHQQKVPNPYTIAALLPDVAVADLLDLQARANRALVEEVLALAEVIAEEAQYRRLVNVTCDLQLRAAKRPGNLRAFVDGAIRDIGRAAEGHGDRPSDMASIGQEVEAEINGPQVVGVPTGFQWLTDRIGGFLPAKIIALVAAYKQRKSTVLRAMVLSAARNKMPVSVMLLEGTRQDFYRDLWALAATDWLWHELPPDQYQEEAILDGDHLATRLRNEMQQIALEVAKREIDRLPIHVADGKDGIADLAVMRSRLARDRFLYDARLVCVDHLQLVDANTGRLFENFERTVAMLQNFTVSEGITSLWLSQMNEAAIGQASNYSPGAKGGGALPAAADHILTTVYDGLKRPNFMTLRLKLSRRAQPGKQDYLINPSSGFIEREATREESNAIAI